MSFVCIISWFYYCGSSGSCMSAEATTKIQKYLNEEIRTGDASKNCVQGLSDFTHTIVNFV